MGFDMGHRIFLPCLLFLLMIPPAYAQTFTEELRDLIDNHKRILATKATVDSLTEGSSISRKAYWPEVSVTALQGHESRKNVEGTLDTGLGASEFDASITQPIDLWHSKGSAVEIAELQLEQGKLGLEQTIQSVILEAITATIGISSATLIEDYARRSVSNIKKQAQLEDARVAKGSGLSTDVLQAKIQLAGAEARLTLAEGALGQSINRYRAVFGYEPPGRDTLPIIILPLSRVPASKDECVRLALENNFQIRSLRSAEELARISIKQTRADQFAPTLNFIVDSKLKNNISGIRGSTNEWIAKFELKYNLNVAGSAFNNVNSSEYNYIATSNQLQDATNLIEEQAKNTFEQYEITQKNANFLENQANIAGEFLALAREERRLGTRSLIDVLSGETAEINALSDAQSAKSQVAIAAYTLLFILGELDVEAVELDEMAALPTKSSQVANTVEPEIQSDFVQADAIMQTTDQSLELKSPANAPTIISAQSKEPEKQSDLVQIESLATTENVLAALTPLPEPEIKGTDLTVNPPRAGTSVAPDSNTQNDVELITPPQPAPIVLALSEIKSPDTSAPPVDIASISVTGEPLTVTSPELEKIESTAKVVVDTSVEFVSEDPNFQRLWSY
ncbi:MAG TPA: TolC family protein [Alphaproteobacteria bacterium]|nr:TolC family protein [Alphaproteobacteria bacterium]